MPRAYAFRYNEFMRIDVAFLPSLLQRPEETVCIVVDVLRATSTLVTLASGGVSRVTIVPELEQAFALKLAAEADPDGAIPLLCGEVGGLPPEGFDYGNSPEEFSRTDVGTREIVLYTSNGTRALVAASAAAAVYAGALLNRSVVASAALRLASEQDLDLTVVCSGAALGTTFSLEDAFCAGALVASALELNVGSATIGDGAQAALRLYHSFAGDAPRAFAAAEHVRLLAKLGLAADLEFCARSDRYAVAPRVMRERGQVVMKRPVAPNSGPLP